MTSNRYITAARQYEDDVLSGAVSACKWVRLAVARNRRDLARAAAGDPAFPYRFDETAATRICMAAEQFPHIKGPRAKVTGRDEEGRLLWATIQLEPWQCWLLSTIFGWVQVADGQRRFRVSLVLVPRKNAKSTLGAIVALYGLTADGESGAEVYSAATTRDQAKVVASIAWEMASRSRAFRDYFGVRLGARTTRSLEVPVTASIFGPLSADANTLDGLNTSLVVVDEVHAHRTRAVWDVLETATGARSQPLIFAISTAGGNIAGICYELLGHLRRILDQAVDDESFFGVEYTIDDGDAWDSEASWRKANPNYGVSVDPADLRRKALKARHSPAALANFKTKHLNLWGEKESGWINIAEWEAGARDDLDIERFARDKVPCWIGVDLAETRDIAAVAKTFVENDKVTVFVEHFLPEAAIDASPIAEYSGWVEEGWLTETEGNTADFERIEETIVEAVRRFNVQEIDFDRALAAHMTQNLMHRLGPQPPVIVVDQSVKTMDPAMRTLDTLIGAGALVHQDDPVLKWEASNLVTTRNWKDEVYPRKAGGKDSPNKIDGMVAILDTLVRIFHGDPEQPSAYATGGLMVVGS